MSRSLCLQCGNGNGSFDLGWSLSIPRMIRKTSKGIPRYRDGDREMKDLNALVLSEAEDLVPVEDLSLDPLKATRYRPRTEGLFAKMVYHHHPKVGINFLAVCNKEGLISYKSISPCQTW